MTELPDGVYIDLPESYYFEAARLGSSDLVRLSDRTPEDWWHGSRHNPNREEPERQEDYYFGKALHAYLLEGQAVFLDQFARSPFESYSEKGAKAWKDEIRSQGKTPLKPKSYASVFAMGELVRAHPQMGPFFSRGLSEVTIFFTFEGLKFRARLDKLLTEFIVDLKTFGNHKSSITDLDTCLDIVVSMKYDVQRYLYDVARREAAALIKAGQVFAYDHDAEEPVPMEETDKAYPFLQRVAERENFKWCWVFYKKVSNNSKNPSAPILTPVVRPPQDASYIRGQERVGLAIERYKSLVDQWGLNTPWARINTAQEPDDTALIGRYEYWKNQLSKPMNISDEDESEAS